jgi:hypothetical protein
MINLYVALTHYPVVNKNGDIISSAVTNLDLHDISRVAKTYGVRAFYVTTPLEDQKALIKKIVSHWVEGTGSTYNPKRREALELIIIKKSLDEVKDHIRKSGGNFPKTVVTSAKHRPDNLSFGKFREMLKDGNLFLLIFGTAWGLPEKLIAEADYSLNPVVGNTDYNHLSVRSAAAIILDRLFRSNA